MASTVDSKTRMTIAEFLELPPPDDARVVYELIDGELTEVTRPRFEHNELLILIASAILAYINEHKVGRLSFDSLVIFDPDEDNSYAPDLIFLASDHLDRLRDGRVWGAPDLVVEVLSPSSLDDDYGRKFTAYNRHGVPWYWIIDPESRRIEENRHTPEGYLRTQTILNGQEFRPGCFPGLVLNISTATPKPDQEAK